MLKAVLFDMDGVIVDTEPLHKKAYYSMFDDARIKVSDALYESFTGQSTMNICKKLVEHFELQTTAENLVSLKRKHFKHLFDTDESLALIEGVEERIVDFHQNGLTLVLASSASMPNINRIFTRFNLDQYFVAKLSGADLKESKPHPEIFSKAAQASGHHTSECLVIEDSTNGIQAAKGANIYCIGYNSYHSTNQDYSKADKVISHFNEIEYNTVSKLFL